MYPQKGRGVVNGKEEAPAFYFGNGNRINQRITAWGDIGVGISANDYMDGTHNSYGVHSVRLLVDGVEVFNSVADKFSFDENRLINSWTDYDEYQKRHRWYMKSFAPGARVGGLYPSPRSVPITSSTFFLICMETLRATVLKSVV